MRKIPRQSRQHVLQTSEEACDKCQSCSERTKPEHMRTPRKSKVPRNSPRARPNSEDSPRNTRRSRAQRKATRFAGRLGSKCRKVLAAPRGTYITSCAARVHPQEEMRGDLLKKSVGRVARAPVCAQSCGAQTPGPPASSPTLRSAPASCAHTCGRARGGWTTTAIKAFQGDDSHFLLPEEEKV